MLCTLIRNSLSNLLFLCQLLLVNYVKSLHHKKLLIIALLCMNALVLDTKQINSCVDTKQVNSCIIFSLLGYGLEKGGISCDIHNTLDANLTVIYMETIPWFLRVYYNSIKIETNDMSIKPCKLPPPPKLKSK